MNESKFSLKIISVVVAASILINVILLKNIFVRDVLEENGIYNVDDYAIIEIHFQTQNYQNDSYYNYEYEDIENVFDTEEEYTADIYITEARGICGSYPDAEGGFIKISTKTKELIVFEEDNYWGQTNGVFNGEDKTYCNEKKSIYDTNNKKVLKNVEYFEEVAQVFMSEKQRVITNEQDLYDYYVLLEGHGPRLNESFKYKYEDFFTKIIMVDSGQSRYIKIEGYDTYEDNAKNDETGLVNMSNSKQDEEYVIKTIVYFKITLSNDTDTFDDTYQKIYQEALEVEEED